MFLFKPAREKGKETSSSGRAEVAGTVMCDGKAGFCFFVVVADGDGISEGACRGTTCLLGWVLADGGGLGSTAFVLHFHSSLEEELVADEVGARTVVGAGRTTVGGKAGSFFCFFVMDGEGISEGVCRGTIFLLVRILDFGGGEIGRAHV